MKTFAEFFAENLYRSDDAPVADFNKDLRSYYHNKRWTSSIDAQSVDKQFGKDADYAAKANGMPLKTKGLFASREDIASLYSAGGRSTPFVHSTDSKGVSTLAFHEKDRKFIEGHHAYVSEFPEAGFKNLDPKDKNDAEYFSEHPPKPLKQTHYDHGLDYTKKFHHVMFVPDLKTHAEGADNDPSIVSVFTQGVG